MKPMGDKYIIKSGKVTPKECLEYAMSLPTSVVITGCDSMKILKQALSVAGGFQPLSEKQVTALLAKTEEVARDGRAELYKTSEHFDGTARNPDWLGRPVSGSISK